MRRLMSLATLLVLCGAIALSAPVYAAGRVQPAKAQVNSVVMTLSVQTSTISFGSLFLQTIRFQVGRWIGLPTWSVTGPGNHILPQKNSHDWKVVKKPWQEITRDAGGDSVDI